MKMRNRLAVLGLAGLMALSAAACAGGGSPSDPLAAAMENMEKVKSMDAQMVMNMDMDIAGTALESVTTMDMSVFSEPMRLKADMTVDMGGYGDTSMQIYAEEEDGGMVMYLFDGMDWTRQETTAEELSQYDAASSMDFYLDNTTSFEQQGTEDLDGASAYKYTGVITGESMQEVMESSGALDSLSTLGMDESQMEELLSGLGDISVTLWIDEETLYPVRYDMDMTAIMDSLMSKMLETLGSDAEGVTMSIPKMTMSMTCSHFDNATDFTVPEEAKNA